MNRVIHTVGDIPQLKLSICHQKFKSYLINKRGKTSKEFKKFVKDFNKRNK
jgi:hypothetical protein